MSPTVYTKFITKKEIFLTL